METDKPTPSSGVDPTRVLLTIAGFDPSSGAGITADLQTFAAHRFFGTACITALTVQSTRGVRDWKAVDASLIADTLECLNDDLPPAGVKIGMLGSAATVHLVARYLKRLPTHVPVVLDPVLLASLGEPSAQSLLHTDGLQVLRQELLPQVNWITPNVPELMILSGMPVETHEQMETASRLVASHFPQLSVLATGGHLQTPDDLVLPTEASAHWIPGVRQHTRATHGTGCALSAAFLCGLLQQPSPFDAAIAAKHFVAEAIRRAPGLGKGSGPLNLLWPLRA